MVIYLSNPKYLCDIIFTLESLLQISVVKRGRSWRYRGAERPKMGCRDTTPPRSALGESGFRGCETVEQGGPIASQSGRVSGSEHKTTVFWFLEIVSGQICRRKMRGGRRRKRKEKENGLCIDLKKSREWLYKQFLLRCNTPTPLQPVICCFPFLSLINFFN